MTDIKGTEAQPAAAQEAVAWQSRFVGGEWGSCSREHNDHVKSVPQEWPDYEVRQLYAAPVAAAPVDLHAHLLHMLGAKDHEDAGWIIGELHAASMSTPAAPGIDLEQFRYSVKRSRCCLENHMKGDPAVIAREIAECDHLIEVIDASPKGGSDAPADMHVTDLAALLWRELSNNGFLIGGPDFESVAHPIDKARFIAIAEIVQDALQATSGEVGA